MLFVILKFLPIAIARREAFYEMIHKRYLARSRNLRNLSNLSILSNLSSLAKSYQLTLTNRGIVYKAKENHCG